MKQRTLTIIKPECVEEKHIGEVIQRIEKAGFEIVGMKMVQLQEKEAKIFYQVHEGKPFYEELVQYMSSGRVVVMVLEKENAVQGFRDFIGATDPQKAAEGTIRRDFGKSIQFNCIHASDSVENAQKEVAFFFSQRELI